MANPWTKKNPFLSMWLSGANALAGKARAAGAAGTSRQRASLTKQVARSWGDAWLTAAKPKPKRRR